MHDDRVWEHRFGNPGVRIAGGTLGALGAIATTLIWLDPDGRLTGEHAHWSLVAGGPFALILGLLLWLGREEIRVDGHVRTVRRRRGVGPLARTRALPFSACRRVEVERREERDNHGRPLTRYVPELIGDGKRWRLPCRESDADDAFRVAGIVARIVSIDLIDRTRGAPRRVDV
jgi:hypothetical protein